MRETLQTGYFKCNNRTGYLQCCNNVFSGTKTDISKTVSVTIDGALSITAKKQDL
jgi:hypothetical protein